MDGPRELSQHCVIMATVNKSLALVLIHDRSVLSPKPALRPCSQMLLTRCLRMVRALLTIAPSVLPQPALLLEWACLSRSAMSMPYSHSHSLKTSQDKDKLDNSTIYGHLHLLRAQSLPFCLAGTRHFPSITPTSLRAPSLFRSPYHAHSAHAAPATLSPGLLRSRSTCTTSLAVATYDFPGIQGA